MVMNDIMSVEIGIFCIFEQTNVLVDIDKDIQLEIISDNRND